MWTMLGDLRPMMNPNRFWSIMLKLALLTALVLAILLVAFAMFLVVLPFVLLSGIGPAPVSATQAASHAPAGLIRPRCDRCGVHGHREVTADLLDVGCGERNELHCRAEKFMPGPCATGIHPLTEGLRGSGPLW